jgi:hypothetical protein
MGSIQITDFQYYTPLQPEPDEYDSYLDSQLENLLGLEDWFVLLSELVIPHN